MRSISMTVVAVAALCLITASPAFGVIMHNDNEPTDRPHDDVVGRWGSNASCVAVASNYVVTTRHQGWGSTVFIGGATYYTHTVSGGDGGGDNADIRIARITTDAAGLHNANLANYVGLYTGTNESGKDFVLGGFGKSRGDDLKTGGNVTYGYEWKETYSHETKQLWGTNHVDATQAGYSGGTSYSSNVLRADFDGSGTTYEAAPSEWDSGGGWFIKVGEEWQLAALSAYVEHIDETWFGNNGNGNPDPDMFRGVRISSYGTWINNTIPEPGTMILLSIGAIGLIRRRRR